MLTFFAQAHSSLHHLLFKMSDKKTYSDVDEKEKETEKEKDVIEEGG